MVLPLFLTFLFSNHKIKISYFLPAEFVRYRQVHGLWSYLASIKLGDRFKRSYNFQSVIIEEFALFCHFFLFFLLKLKLKLSSFLPAEFVRYRKVHCLWYYLASIKIKNRFKRSYNFKSVIIEEFAWFFHFFFILLIKLKLKLSYFLLAEFIRYRKVHCLWYYLASIKLGDRSKRSYNFKSLII